MVKNLRLWIIWCRYLYVKYEWSEGIERKSIEANVRPLEQLVTNSDEANGSKKILENFENDCPSTESKSR